MSAEYGQPSLNELLAQTTEAHGLRDMLTRRGVPKDETVIYNIESDGKVIASYQIPPSCDEAPEVPFLADLREEILSILTPGGKEVPDVPFLTDLRERVLSILTPSSNKVPLTLTDFREEMLDILNRGEDEFGLLSAFPETQTSLFALNLSVGTVEVGQPPVEFPCVKSGIMFLIRRPCPPRRVCAV